MWLLSQEHEQFITEKFSQYDTDKKGTLDREELRGLLKVFRWPCLQCLCDSMGVW